MTTEKALRKIIDFVQIYGETPIEEDNADEITNSIASFLYPHTYRRNPRKAVMKAFTDLEICYKLKYLTYHENGDTLEDVLELTNEGSLRIEKRSDRTHDILFRILCALGGAIGTLACSFIIELIKSKL